FPPCIADPTGKQENYAQHSQNLLLACADPADLDRFVFSRKPRLMRPLKLQLLLKTLQVEQKVLDGLISFVPILSQRLAEDAFQLRRHFTEITRERWRFPVAQNRRHDFVDTGTFERQMSRQQFENHYAKTEDIGPRIHLVSTRLFWRHVDGGAHHDAGVGLEMGT